MSEERLKAISHNLKAQRVKNGLSQGDVAEKLKVTRQSVCNWETDPGSLNLRKIMKLADLYHCEPDFFFGD